MPPKKEVGLCQATSSVISAAEERTSRMTDARDIRMTNNSDYLHTIGRDHAILFSSLLSSIAQLITLLRAKVSRAPSCLDLSITQAALADSTNSQ